MNYYGLLKILKYYCGLRVATTDYYVLLLFKFNDFIRITHYY